MKATLLRSWSVMASVVVMTRRKRMRIGAPRRILKVTSDRMRMRMFHVTMEVRAAIEA